MQWTSEVLYGMLGKHFTLFRRGSAATMGEFSLPVLLEGHEKPRRAGIFVTDSANLPENIPSRSLVVCVGEHPEKLPPHRSSDIVFVEDPGATTILVLNALQRIIEDLMRWSLRLNTLASTGSDVKKLLELSIPIFENRMNIVDYDLKVLAYCAADKSTEPWQVRMTESPARVPSEVIAPYAERLKASNLNREPFFFKEPVGNNYVVNLYEGDTYLGSCSLTDETHPIEPFETELFQIFSDAVFTALKLQGSKTSEQISTIRTVFEHMVQRKQVSQTQVQEALGLVGRSLKHPTTAHEWHCIVIGNANEEHEIPEGYVQRTLEELLPHSFALFHEGRFVVFSFARKGTTLERDLIAPLEGFLHDMNFRAGISRPFDDVFNAYARFRQANTALNTAMESPARMWMAFDEVVLDYMVDQSCGEFDQEDIVAPELVRLASLGPGGIGLEYLETLRAYLDAECNGTKTSEVTFLHRSTLAQRINRIKEIVDLSTPEKRLYLRLCLHLPDVDWEKLAGAERER